MENLLYIYPEIFLSLIAMLLLIFGVFNQKEGTSTLTLSVSSFALVVAFYIYFYIDFGSGGQVASIFNGSFEFSDFIYILKILVLFSGWCKSSNFSNGLNCRLYGFRAFIFSNLRGGCS